MINYINENLFRSPNAVSKAWTILGSDFELSNSDLYSESIEITESICNEGNLIFGTCNASTLKFTTFNTAVSFEGKVLNVSVVLNEDYEHPFVVGTYIVDKETLSADKTKKEIIAYDKLSTIIHTNVASWYNGLSFPLTLKQFRESFCNNFNLTFVSRNLVNDNMVVEKTIDVVELGGGKVLSAICELNGAFPNIIRANELDYKILNNTPVYNITRSMWSNFEYADYAVEPISKLQIRQEENDIGVIVGSGTNVYIIEDNFLVYGKSSEALRVIAENLFSVINNIAFVPCNIDCINANPCVEVGDRITVEKDNNTTITTYLVSRHIKGLQKLSENIESKGEQTYPDNVTGIDYDIRQLKGKANILQRSIEETRLTIVDVERGLHSEIVQTAEGLEIEIESLQSQIDGEIEYFETTETPTLLNYPYWDFCTNLPCNGTIQLAPIYNADGTVGGDQYPHFVYTEQNRQDHLRDLVFDTENVVSYRFNKRTVGDTVEWYWQEIAESETTYILSQIAELRATAEALTSEYTELSADLSSGYYTKVQTDSKIEQSASRIQTTVSQTYATKTTTNSLQSQITQQADLISGKVSSTGGSASSFSYELTSTKWVLKSNNQTVFKCDRDGIVVSGNATFTGTVRSSNIVGSTIEGAIITGGTLNGTFTMGENASFATFRFDGSFVQKTDKVAFYGASSSPTMRYDSSFGGYVPVFSSPGAFQRYMGMSQYSLGTKVLIC